MNFTSLSPLLRDGIFHNLIARDTNEALESRNRREKGRVVEVVMYRCAECDELHDDEDDAAECCADDAVDGLHDEEAPDACPVCGLDHIDAYSAADCCLWKDIDAPTRWRMADRVEAGESWSQVLEVRK